MADRQKEEIKTRRQEQLPEVEAGEKEFATWSARIPMKAFYTPQDLEEKQFDYMRDVGLPGEFPFVRGVDSEGYRKGLWDVSQVSGYGLPEHANKRFKYLIENGMTGLLAVIDLPSQLGYDSDHPMAKGEVGVVGVAIDSLRDFEVMYEGIPLNSLDVVGCQFNATGPIAVALYVALCEKQKISPNDCNVKIQNAILKEFLGRGMWIFPPKPSVKFAVDAVEYCAKNIPRWHPLMICGAHLRGSGANIVQELAFAMANAVTYIEDALSRGLNIDDFAPQFESYFSVYSLDIFEEIAKIRAWRKIWARILKERYGARKPESMRTWLSCMTSGSVETRQEPLNNIARIAIQALTAILFGPQTLATVSYDEAIGIPTKEAARIALRTQQIIANETQLVNTVDPLAGSYYLEWLTMELEKRALSLFEEIEKMGGSLTAIENGYYQREMAKEAYRFQKDLETGSKIKVCVNKFRTEEPPYTQRFKLPPEIEEQKIAGLKELKKNRDNEKVTQTLKGIREAALADENLVPPILDAVKAYATIGEITDVLRDIWGEYKPAAFVF